MPQGIDEEESHQLNFSNYPKEDKDKKMASDGSVNLLSYYIFHTAIN